MAWIVPILAIIFSAVLTQKTTHALEPSKPLAHDERPIIIEVVPMDRKWFLIYSEQGIATVNETAFPANTPVHFKMTSNSAMNPFFVPRPGSQIYTVAGTQTRLHLIANEPGTYDDISANYSDPGFSGMKFKATVTPDRAVFGQWVAKAEQSPNTMSDMVVSEKLAAPNEYSQVEYLSNMRLNLFADMINKFMVHGKSMDITQPEGEHSVHEGMEGMDMSHVESAH